mmetsp:Transcript_20194/g.63432  ORF Transcript_20194/g.63432 Transcript_20194/m.63432 type:complete len:272 (-) Transcript_20194:517-1332(-)
MPRRLRKASPPRASVRTYGAHGGLSTSSTRGQLRFASPVRAAAAVVAGAARAADLPPLPLRGRRGRARPQGRGSSLSGLAAAPAPGGERRHPPRATSGERRVADAIRWTGVRWTGCADRAAKLQGVPHPAVPVGASTDRIRAGSMGVECRWARSASAEPCPEQAAPDCNPGLEGCASAVLRYCTWGDAGIDSRGAAEWRAMTESSAITWREPGVGDDRSRPIGAGGEPSTSSFSCFPPKSSVTRPLRSLHLRSTLSRMPRRRGSIVSDRFW